MKLLVVSDIHGSDHAVAMIGESIREVRPHATVVCGDITNFGSAERAREIIDDLPGVVLAVPGNCDPPGVVDGVSESHGIDLHGMTSEINGMVFAGFGGGKRSYGTPREYTGEYIGKNLRKVLPGADILVLHCPPHGINDLTRRGHGGSEEIAKAVKRYKPMLVLSGHIHECYGVIEDAGTVYINPGAAKWGRSAYLEIDRENKKVREGSVRLMSRAFSSNTF